MRGCCCVGWLRWAGGEAPAAPTAALAACCSLSPQHAAGCIAPLLVPQVPAPSPARWELGSGTAGTGTGLISSLSEVVRLLPPLPLSNPFSAAFKTQPLCSWNCGWLPATGPCFDFKCVGFAPFHHKVQTGTAWLRQNKFCPGVKGGQLFLRLLPAAALSAARCLRPGSANR